MAQRYPDIYTTHTGSGKNETTLKGRLTTENFAMAFDVAKAVADSKRVYEKFGVTEIGINVGDKPYPTVTAGLEYCMELSVAANNLTVIAYPFAGSDEEIARFVNGAALAL